MVKPAFNENDLLDLGKPEFQLCHDWRDYAWWIRAGMTRRAKSAKNPLPFGFTLTKVRIRVNGQHIANPNQNFYISPRQQAVRFWSMGTALFLLISAFCSMWLAMKLGYIDEGRVEGRVETAFAIQFVVSAIVAMGCFFKFYKNDDSISAQYVYWE